MELSYALSYVNHYLHTKRGTNIQKLITRNGDCYDLTPQDDNKKSFEKQFLAKFPKLRAKEPAEVRRWYRAIVGRAKEFHLYLHPYYNFRREVNHNRGFTVGDDFPDDVPKRYETAIDEWGILLHRAMCQDKIIPDSCGTMKATVINFEEGQGYEALWGVVRSTHPNNLPWYETNELIRSYPQQREDEEFEHYYFRFNDHLQMKAYLTHPCSLDEPQEISALIGGCINHVELKKLTAHERELPHKLYKYRHGNILGTLQMFEMKIASEKMELVEYQKTRKSVPPSITKRASRFSKPFRYSSDRTASTAISSLTTHPINLLDSIGLPEEDPDIHPDIWDVYIHAIDKIDKNPREFDTSRKCLVCNDTGHAFADCPALNDTASLKAHRIEIGKFLRNLRVVSQKAIEAKQKRIYQIMATELEEDYEKIEQEDSDFQLGRE